METKPTPARADRRKLKALQTMCERMDDYYSTLDRATKHFLCTEFTGETELHLRQFNQNIKDTIEEVEK